MTMLRAPSQEMPMVGSDRDAKIDGAKGPASRFDPLADLVVRRWFDAWQYRQSWQLSDCGVETVLQRCYRQRAGIYEPDELGLLDGIDIYIPLTDMKSMAAEAWLRDMLASVLDMPFTIEPTPIPELPARLKQKVLRDLKIEIAQATMGDALGAAQALASMAPQAADVAFGNMIASYPGDIMNVAARMKQAAMSLALTEASSATEKMAVLMRDQLVEMNFGRVLYQFFHDLVTYPVAILKGPFLVERPKIVWRGNTRTVKMEQVPDAYRVAPFDFFPSADSPDAQRGTFVIEKVRMTRRSLAWAKGQRFWIGENVDRILEEYRTWQRNWLVWDSATQNLEQPSQASILWGDEESIDMLEHHGIVSGRELRSYGFSAGDREFFEAKIAVIGGRTVCVKVNGSANCSPRPYHATSYEKQGDQFYNICPVMKLRDVQRTVNAAVRAQIRNMSYSSGPIAEIDVTRVQRYVKDLQELLRVDPYSVLLTDPDNMNGGRPARNFQNIPNILGPLMQTIQFYMRMADDVSNIPAYAQGDTGLSGAGRTYRGFSAVFAQALKVFKMPVQNMDKDIFEPFANMLYAYNMTTAKDDSVKGDARCRARGSQGLVDMEQQQQKALEAMQVVMQMSPAVAELDPEGTKKVLRYTWAKAMQALGVPMDAFGINPEVEAALNYQQTMQGDQYTGPDTPIPPVNAQTPPPG